MFCALARQISGVESRVRACELLADDKTYEQVAGAGVVVFLLHDGEAWRARTGSAKVYSPRHRMLWSNLRIRRR